MFKIGIIKKNNYSYTRENQERQSFIKEIMLIDIEKYVELKEIEKTYLMDEICDVIKLKPEYIGDTDIIYQDLNNVIMMCYLSLKDNNSKDNEKDYNELGSYLLGKKVYGDIVILNSKIDNNTYTCVDESVDYNIIANLLYDSYVHKGIVSYVDGKIEEFTYYLNPASHKIIDRSAKYMICELNIFNFNLNIIFKEKTSENINKFASKLVGKNVYGNVIFILKENDNLYKNINEELIMKIYKNYNSILNSKIINMENKEGELKKICNGYCILNQLDNKQIDITNEQIDLNNDKEEYFESLNIFTKN